MNRRDFLVKASAGTCTALGYKIGMLDRLLNRSRVEVPFTKEFIPGEGTCYTFKVRSSDLDSLQNWMCDLLGKVNAHPLCDAAPRTLLAENATGTTFVTPNGRKEWEMTVRLKHRADGWNSLPYGVLGKNCKVTPGLYEEFTL